MRTYVLALISGLLVGGLELGHAQFREGERSSAAAAASRSQEAWQQYLDRRGADGGLEDIMAGGALPATQENVASVLAALRSNPPRDEQINLLRIAGQMHRGTQDVTSKTALQQQISVIAIGTSDARLGKAATLVYSRLGFFPDSLQVLSRAHERGFISHDDYYGDLTHLLPAAPTALDQSKVISELGAGNNAFSREVLAGLLVNRDIVKNLKPEAACDVAVILMQNEPGFGSSNSTISTADCLAYADWMGAVVGLNAMASGEPESAVMARLLKIDGTHPKKLIAVMISEPTARLVRRGFDTRSIQKIDSAIASFSRNSNNPTILDLSRMARSNLVGAS
jgi:hypothetical protein